MQDVALKCVYAVFQCHTMAQLHIAVMIVVNVVMNSAKIVVSVAMIVVVIYVENVIVAANHFVIVYLPTLRDHSHFVFL